MARSTTWPKRLLNASPKPVSRTAVCSEYRSRSRSRARSGSRGASPWRSSGAGGESMPRVFVAVGSNVAPEENVTRALRMLDEEIGILGLSTFYRTPALHRPEDPSYVNGAVEVSDALGPFDLKELLRRIERVMGRELSLIHISEPTRLLRISYAVFCLKK